MGFVDYFSRNRSGAVTPPSEEDTHFHIKQKMTSNSLEYRTHYAAIEATPINTTTS